MHVLFILDLNGFLLNIYLIKSRSHNTKLMSTAKFWIHVTEKDFTKKMEEHMYA